MNEKKEWFKTLEEFVYWELTVNKGSHTQITKKDMAALFNNVYPDIKVTAEMSKQYMLDEILKKYSLTEIYDMHPEKFGIKPSIWKYKFNLTDSQRKKMEKEGYLLFPAYTSYERVFTGTYADVQYYQAKSYFTYTLEEVEKWKEENIRGYKKRKEAAADAES